MSDPIILAEGVGKKYQLGRTGAGMQYDTLRETLTEGTQQLFRRSAARKKQREEFWALRDLNFSVTPGEVIGIIGLNGAGKSTLLKILCRITEPTEGRVRIKGRIAGLLEIGTGFHPELTGRENIFLNGAILGMTRAEIRRKFDEIVDFSEVEPFLDVPVKRFSSGMYVRLAFAVAANLDPEILLIDEVLSIGDAAFQKKCLGKMSEVSLSKGRTILFVSHQMNAIERLCSRAVWIDHGRLRMDSNDVRSVIRTYLSSGKLGPTRGEWHNANNQFDNEWFQPQRFFLADGHGQPLEMPAKGDDEIWLYLEADFKALDPALMIGYSVYSEAGDLLYRSFHNDAKEEEWPRLKLGRAVLRGRIPSRLLNEGTYRLELVGLLYFRQWIFEPGSTAPTVFLDLQGGLSDSPLRNGKRPGLLAPVLPWELWTETK
jgi:homopolymeric O-antigen transport system ATP-binding protein